MQSTAPGQISIKTSCGPCAHSMSDLKLLTKTILLHSTFPYEPTCIPASWSDVPPRGDKLKIGILSTDGVVTPHPPIQRALQETAAKLRSAGHEGNLYNGSLYHDD